MLEGDMEELRRRALTEHMIGDMLAMHFLTLVAGFAVTSKSAARDMLHTIEHDTARGLTQLRDEFIKGPGGNDVLVEVATRLRETFMQARQRIEDATNPH